MNIIPEDVVQRLFCRWVQRLNLQTYKIELFYLRSVENTGTCLGRIKGQSGHFSYQVELAWAEAEDFDDLRYTLIHELVHIWTWLKKELWDTMPEPTQWAVDECFEHVTCQTARYICESSKQAYMDEDLKKECQP